MKSIKQAFTLVELIVVVTILAILATIGFVSYSGYLTGVRDTNRVASLTAISDGLELYRTKNDLPLPDGSVEVQIESETIARQGYAGSNVLQTIEYSKAGKDPKDDQYYSYYLTDDKKHYQMMAFLEERDNLESRINHSAQPHPNPLLRGEGIAQIEKNKATKSNILLPSPLRRGVGGEVIFVGLTHAATDYSNRHPKVYGKRLGILTDDNNTPIQEISHIKTAGNLNMTGGTIDEYKMNFTDILNVQGSGSTLIEIKDVFTPKKNKPESCREALSPNTFGKSGFYDIYPNGNKLSVYCDMTSDFGGWTLITEDMIEDFNLNVVTTIKKDPNDGLIYGFKTTGIIGGCGGTGIAKMVQEIKLPENINWSHIKYNQKFYGGASCWHIFGNQATNDFQFQTNINSFDLNADKIYDEFKMGTQSNNTFNGDAFRCDNDTDNFWHNLNGPTITDIRKAKVILRRGNINNTSYLSTHASCIGNDTGSEYSNIYIK